MDIEAEDAKLVTLAKASRARIGAEVGAAVRDQDGRTYTAASIAREHLKISALDLAVAMAISSGATSLEAAAFASDEDANVDLAAVRDIAQESAIIVYATAAGDIRQAVAL